MKIAIFIFLIALPSSYGVSLQSALMKELAEKYWKLDQEAATIVAETQKSPIQQQGPFRTAGRPSVRPLTEVAGDMAQVISEMRSNAKQTHFDFESEEGPSREIWSSMKYPAGFLAYTILSTYLLKTYLGTPVPYTGINFVVASFATVCAAIYSHGVWKGFQRPGYRKKTRYYPDGYWQWPRKEQNKWEIKQQEKVSRAMRVQDNRERANREYFSDEAERAFFDHLRTLKKGLPRRNKKLERVLQKDIKRLEEIASCEAKLIPTEQVRIEIEKQTYRIAEKALREPLEEHLEERDEEPLCARRRN